MDHQQFNTLVAMVGRLETLREQLYALGQNFLVDEGTETDITIIENIEQGMDECFEWFETNLPIGVTDMARKAIVRERPKFNSDEEFLLAHESDLLFYEMQQIIQCFSSSRSTTK